MKIKIQGIIKMTLIYLSNYKIKINKLNIKILKTILIVKEAYVTFVILV